MKDSFGTIVLQIRERQHFFKKSYKEMHPDFYFQQKLEIGGGRRQDFAFQLDTRN